VTATRRRLLGLAAGVVLADAESSSRAQSPDEGLAARLMDDLMWNRGPIGGPFALIDHICPADLMQIGLAMNGLGPAGEAVQPLFITLDPERDTAARLADYVPLFHPRLIGLTGSAEEIRRAALAFKVYYAKYPPDTADYVVDHSSFVYLVDAAGKYIGFFPPGTTADRMIEMITPHLHGRVNEYGR